LSISEIRTGILLSDELEKSSSVPNTVFDIERTLKKCGAFVQIVESGAGQKTVTLVHDTFREFILGPPTSPELSKFFINAETRNATLAAACLTYLTRESIEPEYSLIAPSARRADLDTAHPLFSYASLYWAAHVAASNSDLVLTTALRRFLSPKTLKCWLHSVIAYTFDGAAGSLYDPLSLSIPSQLLQCSDWIHKQNVSIDWEDIHDGFITWATAVVAEAWLEDDPKYYYGPVRIFQIARELYLSSHPGIPVVRFG
jgi:hypothetical protein